jgi:hypothetical protein
LPDFPLDNPVTFDIEGIEAAAYLNQFASIRAELGAKVRNVANPDRIQCSQSYGHLR